MKIKLLFMMSFVLDKPHFLFSNLEKNDNKYIKMYARNCNQLYHYIQNMLYSAECLNTQQSRLIEPIYPKVKPS